MAGHDESEVRKRLAKYLTDHEGGSASGRALARRLLDANDDTSYAAVFRRLLDEIEEDSASLQRIRESLGIRSRPLKLLSGPVTSIVGRLNGLVGEYTALHRLREIEALAGGVATKRALWETLRAAERPEIDRVELDRLIDRAEEQYATLMGARDQTAAEAFGGRQRAADA